MFCLVLLRGPKRNRYNVATEFSAFALLQCESSSETIMISADEKFWITDVYEI